MKNLYNTGTEYVYIITNLQHEKTAGQMNNIKYHEYQSVKTKSLS